MKERNLKILKGLLSVLILVGIIFIIKKLNIFSGNSTKNIEDFVKSYGSLAPIIYIIMFALVPLTLFPDSILAITGGILFGLLEGYIYTTIGAMIGGSISFYISKILGRDFIKNIAKNKLDKLEKIIEDKGFVIVILLRLIPLFPFDVISYGAGLTSIKYKDFILATLIGTIPGILVFTNIGAQWVNVGKSSFYLSIAMLIGLIVISIFMKKRFLSKDLREE
ncbi:TVP38/TMEM64 family protein [Clostridium hydrogeniformans]|uniref:TVP38/TMEM64 family protein n=1 Tax=Clostridium hydrogeniformans TaxID=349933 RepID=UPI00048833FB|nr:TVP38/TMEM64 family protein [Clostridium hydrogeniformans]